MADWINVPVTPPSWPIPGERIVFARNGEISEGICIVDHVDTATNTIYFRTPIPDDIQTGDTILGIGCNH